MNLAPLILAAATATAPLRIGTTTPIANLSPAAQVPGVDHYVRNFVAPPVVALGPSWQWRCVVCTVLPSVAAGTLVVLSSPKKGMTATFAIGPQWRWGDGTPVTGRDVAFTFRSLRAQHTDPLTELPSVLKVTVDEKDERRFTLYLNHLRSDAHTLLAISLMPAHLEAQIFPKGIDEGGATGIYASQPTNPGLYYGTYRPRVVTNDEVSLEATGEVTVKSIILHRYPTSETLGKAVQSGEMDMTKEGDLSVDELTSLTATGEGRNLHAMFAATHVLEHLVLNTRNPLLADQTLRQALLVGLDRDRIVAEIYHNYAVKTDQLFHPRDPLAANAVKAFPFNPKQAESLLDAAGWRLNTSGVRVKAGMPLTLTIDTLDDKARRRVFSIIKDSWRKLGIGVELIVHAPTPFYRDIVAQAKFRDAVLLAWDQPPATGLWLALHSRDIPTADNDFTGQNVGAFSRKDADNALLAIFRTLDPAAAKESARTLMGIYMTELPTLPLVLKPTGAIVPVWLENVQLPGHTFESSLYSSSWRRAVETAERLF